MLAAIHLGPAKSFHCRIARRQPPQVRPGASGRGPRTCYQRRPDHATSNCTPSPRPCLSSCPLTARSVRPMSGQKPAACAEGSYPTSVAELRSTSQAALVLLSRALVPDPFFRGMVPKPQFRPASCRDRSHSGGTGRPRNAASRSIAGAVSSTGSGSANRPVRDWVEGWT